VDQLLGLKENVILGHMIPAGTGFKAHYRTKVQKNVSTEELKRMETEAEKEEEARLDAEEQSMM
jgi:DNA-directed RNA polymerase subunit beta'